MSPRAAAPLLIVLACTARAQTKIDHPFYGELGVALPTARGVDAGVAAAIGASFVRRHGLTLSAEVRAMSYDTGTDAGPFQDDDSGELFSPITFGLDARYQPRGQRLFVGAGLNAAQLDAATDTTSSTTRLGYDLEAGYGFSRRIYGIVRYQGTFDDVAAYRAVTVGVGYRF